MKDAFKKGFGVILGIYCGFMATNFIDRVISPNECNKTETKEESKEEEA